jgi:hypothetical protein
MPDKATTVDETCLERTIFALHRILRDGCRVARRQRARRGGGDGGGPGPRDQTAAGPGPGARPAEWRDGGGPRGEAGRVARQLRVPGRGRQSGEMAAGPGARPAEWLDGGRPRGEAGRAARRHGGWQDETAGGLRTRDEAGRVTRA